MRQLRTSVTLVALLGVRPDRRKGRRRSRLERDRGVHIGQLRARVRTLSHASWRSRSSPCSKPSTRSRGDYQPYLGTVVAPAGASADAAAVAAAYQCSRTTSRWRPNLDAAYAASLAAIPDGPAKSGGIATGQAAAAQMIALRLGDGSSPPQFYAPASTDPGVWQLTPSCPAAGGSRFSVAKHDTVRCAERSRQPGVDRAVCPGSAPGAHEQRDTHGTTTS